MQKKSKIVLGVLGILLTIFFVVVVFQKPKNDRDWSLEQTILPYVEVVQDQAKFFNIRDFRYTDSGEEVKYRDQVYKLDAITSLDYIVVPFTDQVGAHTMLSFGFEDGEYLAISVEIRKEEGEIFSAWRGMFNQYEIMYVVADERDVIDLRVRHRDDDLYLYPVKSTQEGRKEILLSMIERINTLKDQPEFYNTLTNNCTTSIVGHVNELLPGKISWSPSFVLPEHSDKTARKIDLLDVDSSLTLEEMRAQYYVSDRAKETPLDKNYSKNIRLK